MKKIYLVVGTLLLISLISLVVGYLIQPQTSIMYETIKPQIICYGGGC